MGPVQAELAMMVLARLIEDLHDADFRSEVWCDVIVWRWFDFSSGVRSCDDLVGDVLGVSFCADVIGWYWQTPGVMLMFPSIYFFRGFISNERFVAYRFRFSLLAHLTICWARRREPAWKWGEKEEYHARSSSSSRNKCVSPHGGACSVVVTKLAEGVRFISEVTRIYMRS